MITPSQVKALIAGLLLLVAIAAGYFAVKKYNDAIESAAMSQVALDAALVANKDFASQLDRLKADRAVNDKAADRKTVELQKQADVQAKKTKEFKNEIASLEEIARTCARSTVPVAVDRLLTKDDN